MASPTSSRAALGLSLGDPGPSTAAAANQATYSPSISTPRARKASTPYPAPILTQEPEGTGGGEVGIEPNPNHHGQMSIPPPPSPRRHRQGAIMSRVRAHSGGHSGSMSTSKSWTDVTLKGFGMTSATPVEGRSPMSRSPEDECSTMARRSASDGTQLPEGDTDESWENESGSYDNSARFYYRMQNSSRQVSPTRSTVSATPSAPSASSSPLPRRNLTLPPGSMGHSPGASLSATLSPNSRFLQQHLPPTFPLSLSQQPSPDLDVYDPLSPPPPLSHAQVILTPTTQEWRELKELGRLEGTSLSEEALSSDNDSLKASSSATSAEKLSDKIDYFNVKDKVPEEGSAGETPTKPVFKPVVTAPSPLPDTAADTEHPEHQASGDSIESTDSTSSTRVPDLILEDNDDSTNEDSPVITVSSPRGFASFGRRDSLRVKSRPAADKDGPKAKTRRELERERLFKMVDQEIAATPAEEMAVHSWSVSNIGRGGGLDSRGSTSSLEPDRQLGMTPSPPSSSSSSSMMRSTSMPGDEIPPPLIRHFSNNSSTAPVNPSPLHAATFIGATTSENVSSGVPSSAASDVDLSSPDEPLIEVLASVVPETESERFEAIRDYSRSFKATGSRPGSRVVSRATSRRGSQEEEASPKPRRSPRSRDTTRISLVEGRVVRPLTFSAIAPLTTADKTKHSLQSFSPFRTGSPGHPAVVKSVMPVLDGVKGELSAAPSTVAPSECGTPPSENVGGVGGHGISDYVIQAEAGKGAYGLVMRARVKGAGGQPVGDEIIIKYIIKSRILADCWKKHKVLGPIPVEIHVMDQVRHLIYHPPKVLHPWDPSREDSTKSPDVLLNGLESGPSTPRSDSSQSNVTTQKYISSELKHSPERGHPNVAKLLDFFEDREFYYLVMPRYGTGVDLFDYVESHPDGLPPFEIRSLVGQLTDAIRFLHANGIVHRDIKDENVILDGSGRCQLIDFGSAAHWRPGKRWDTFSGTLHYASPEILRGEMYGGKEQDVWALGTVAYVLLVGETPFADLPDEVFVGLAPGSRAEEALEERCGAAHEIEGREPDGGGSLGDAADFVRSCLAQEVAERPTAEQLLGHRYLAGMDGWVGKRGWERKR